MECKCVKQAYPRDRDRLGSLLELGMELGLGLGVGDGVGVRVGIGAEVGFK